MKDTKSSAVATKEKEEQTYAVEKPKSSKPVKETKTNQTDLSKLVFYADSSDVNMVDSKDDDDYLEIDTKHIKKQSMEGFGDYHNIIDYIVRITRQIWKEKDIGLIYDTYSHGVQIHRGLINSHGVNEVVAGTLQTLQSFPDRTGLGWSIVWSGNDKEGFFTSHRGRSIGTNLGDTLYGPATGNKVVFRTTADCLIHENKIYEEWLVMDTFHLVQQLGYDPIEIAKRTAKQTSKLAPSLQFSVSQSAESGLQPRAYVPQHDGFEIGDFMLMLFNQVWDRRSINKVKDFYDNNAVLHYVCNKDMVGQSEIQGMFINLFASVPNSKVIVERVTCNKRNNEGDWDVAVRWRVQGLHSGIGYFGAPSGKPIEIHGMNHYKVRNEKILEEWMLFDGMEVLRQIYTENDVDRGSESEGHGIDDGNFTGVS
ncbi:MULTISPECIES: ester cyclase [Oceanobacillus]|uniref:Polyketide cyclase n=1 Tax=Oceanobacillus kimchii TaxID=746691 RepID=A0ABQ5TPL6_9BACI|nr:MULTISPECIES: ester cyclase [Oceanobacillus]MBT2600508.1 ester cyclase [Oceanobacillus sp. ISL-74]MBT2650666.1 ester cyclase [Oceanobacillus sp. ISL-73]OEH54792.1 polyketide cyclase [Oceanobacillus sp. E9]GLO67558.1 polyketide cyclase [Oceanobacillus kimchii]